MANSYITLSSYKFTIDAGSPGRNMPEDIVRVTLGGTTLKSLGNFKRRWTYGIQAKYSADVGYGSRATLQNLAEDRTVAGQSLNLTDEFGANQGTVYIVSCTYPDAIVSSHVDDADAIYRSTIVLQED